MMADMIRGNWTHQRVSLGTFQPVAYYTKEYQMDSVKVERAEDHSLRLRCRAGHFEVRGEWLHHGGIID
jgi:hypothetical protein